MRRLVMLVCAIGFIAFASIAQGDEANSPTCGANTGKFATAYDIFHDNTFGWTVDWKQNCGYGGTVEWEVQRSVDASHWSDLVDNLATTSGADANVTTIEERYPNAGGCSNSYFYRLHVWPYGGTATDTKVRLGAC